MHILTELASIVVTVKLYLLLTVILLLDLVA